MTLDDFAAALAGRYQVCLGFRPAMDQATNTPVTIRHAGGTAKLTVNQRTETTPFNLVALGEFSFRVGDNGFVEIANGNTDGTSPLMACAGCGRGENSKSHKASVRCWSESMTPRMHDYECAGIAAATHMR